MTDRTTVDEVSTREPAAPTGLLADRASGCLAGAAVGDALGAPTERRTPDQIRERYGGWVEGVVPPWFDNWREARPEAPFYQGDGRITDDTLMAHAMVEVYCTKRDHLTAHDALTYLVPLMIGERRWIPELDTEALLLQRMFLSVKWIVLRLHYGHVEPREAGAGNMMDSGAAMYAAPFGVVNAGNPDAAYAEAIDFTGAHQHSYAREAAGAVAVAVAAAMAPDATVDSVLAACLRLVKDGTRAAIEAVCEVARDYRHWTDPGALAALRAAMAPYDTMGPDYTDMSVLSGRRPSRLHSIEEVPLAIGFVVMARGDYVPSVLGGVNYGRDSDSIASIAGSVAGALGGLSTVPAAWVRQISEASRTDLVAPAERLAEVAASMFDQDLRRRRAHERAMRELLGETDGAAP